MSCSNLFKGYKFRWICTYYICVFLWLFLILVERFRSIVEYRQDFREKKKCTNKHWNKYDFSWWSKDRMTGYLKIDPNVMYMRKKRLLFVHTLVTRIYFEILSFCEHRRVDNFGSGYTIHDTQHTNEMKWKSINVKLNYRVKPFCCYYFECNLMHKYVMQQ